MQHFNFLSPTKITFGEGTASGIADALFELGARNPLVVTDKILLEKGVLRSMLTGLAEGGISNPIIFSDVPSDSDVDCVRQAVALARENACDSIIAVGGGSVIDTAKVVNIGLTLGGDLLDYEGINNLKSPLCPLIVLPTTAGTGSEVSAVAMIKDHESGKKLLYGSHFLFANASILDPALLVSLPAKLTAANGLDAVTHAIESFVALGSNPFTDSFALHALSLLFLHLPRATKYGDDIEARSQTLLASTMAGISFTNSGVGIVHALAHTVGAKYSVHHGVANAIFLPHGMQFNLDVSKLRYAQIWRYLCTAIRACPSAESHLSDKFIDVADDQEAALQLVKAVKDLLIECSLPYRLRDANVPEFTEDELAELSDTAMTDPAIMFNPKEADSDALISILKGAY